MTQQQIGNTLIAQAQEIAAAGGDLQAFYDGLETEAFHLVGNDEMPLGWVANAILAISRETDCPIQDPMAPAPHSTPETAVPWLNWKP